MRFPKTSIAILALLLTGTPLATWADEPSQIFLDEHRITPLGRIVGFGDSLSDPGNAYALTGMQSLPPYMPVPQWPYAIGDNHYSNGPTWLEQLADAVPRPRSGEPAIVEGRPYSNYAVGGARARPGGDAPGLSAQVGVFLAHNQGVNLRPSLIVIALGGNDIRDALFAAQAGDVAGAIAVIQAAIESTSNNMQTLYAAGARNFLIVSPPNLALTPAIMALGQPIIDAADLFSTSYAAALEDMLDLLELAFADISIKRLDLAILLGQVMADPQAYGLSTVFVPCLRFGVIVDAVCDHPEDHLFWDALHPTEAAHGILADAAAELLGFAKPRPR